MSKNETLAATARVFCFPHGGGRAGESERVQVGALRADGHALRGRSVAKTAAWGAFGGV